MGEDLRQGDADLFGLIKREYDLPDSDAGNWPPLTLAYIGDAVYEVVIRSAVSGSGDFSAGKMNKRAGRLVRAQAQSEIMKNIRPMLTKAEDDQYRRGRNAHPHTKAKHASVSDYLRATGLETLIGYLYITGKTKRLLQLIKAGTDSLKENP